MNKHLEEFIKNKNVSFFGYKNKNIPDILKNKDQGLLRFFIRKETHNSNLEREYSFSEYEKLLDIAENAGEICFFDHDALKVFLIGFPRQTNFVFVRLVPRLSWFFALPGLVRRIFKKRLKIRGVVRLQVANGYQRWVVIEKIVEEMVTHKQATLSEEVGISGLIKFLNEKGVNYIVLRFFEKLPELYRKGGDLDVLVSDEDKQILFDFVDKNPGAIPVDIYTASDPMYKMVSYYPPPIAKKMLKDSIIGPGGARVPNPKDAFLNMAYHCTYHKGFGSGVPSSLHDYEFFREPDNDYKAKLAEMAKAFNLSITITLEDLDEYLNSEGWRPKRDTLAKLVHDNEWIKKRFFSEANEDEVGLGVFILKENAFEMGVVDKVLDLIRKEKVAILKHKRLSGDEKKHVADHLRGGNWTEGRSYEGSKSFMPGMTLVVLDLLFHHFDGKGKYSDEYNRLRALKNKIRSSFDSGDVSIVHATDNTEEAWEYVDVCFPEDREFIKKEIENVFGKHELGAWEKIKNKTKHFKRMIIMKFKNFIIDFLSERK